MWAKLNTSAGWMWFVEGQFVTSVRHISSQLEGTPPLKKFSEVYLYKKSRKWLYIYKCRGAEFMGYQPGFLFLSSASRFCGKGHYWFECGARSILIHVFLQQQVHYSVTAAKDLRGEKHNFASKGISIQSFLLLPIETPKCLFSL